ncbi:hypothetical protein XELAEV_18040419mg [Xenopus laevis]|uniref:G-protein coupled receptors family 1 profile domain-containing protein n=1 Tax=Xenopus laevis TaxID=8355 RepID=A0A974H920_XENLA|nr:hypothetical protein XELAEV_18040419mg [Xenopus laevis]
MFANFFSDVRYIPTGCWAVGFINSSIHVTSTFQLPFCRSHHVNHFFCEVPPFFQLSCQDTWFNEVSIYMSACTIGLCSFFLTLISYVYIIPTILKIDSTQGRQKAFSTCASHLTVVSLYYGTTMFMYLRPHSSYSPETDKTVSIIYTVVIPMLNPIIYSLRNRDVKVTIKKMGSMITNRREFAANLRDSRPANKFAKRPRKFAEKIRRRQKFFFRKTDAGVKKRAPASKKRAPASKTRRRRRFANFSPFREIRAKFANFSAKRNGANSPITRDKSFIQLNQKGPLLLVGALLTLLVLTTPLATDATISLSC